MLRTLMVLLLAAPAFAQPNLREQKVRADKAKAEADGYWLYNDLPAARATAAAEKKPIVAVLRCVPCEECVKLDDDDVNADPRVRPLLDRFVRVRLVSTNGLDLSLFQFDYDQSFAVFFLNADGTVYGRFGTRSHRTNWVGDVSVPGLAEALKGALELHAGYPANKAALAGKRGPAPAFPVPEKFPTLTKYTDKLDYAGKVVPSCVHCHQIGDAMKDLYRARREPPPEEVLFPYPHPKTHGLILDPKERATVLDVTPKSAAAASGFRPGDRLASLAGQPLLSIADVQWVLHRTPGDAAAVPAKVLRAGTPLDLSWSLPAGWKRQEDLYWRASSWGLRRTALGGLKLDEADGRLRVAHVGQYGPHAAAKAAGFKVGDVIVSFDGKADWSRETDLLVYGVTVRKPGDKVPVVVRRDGQPVELTLTLPE